MSVKHFHQVLSFVDVAQEATLGDNPIVMAPNDVVVKRTIRRLTQGCDKHICPLSRCL